MATTKTPAQRALHTFRTDCGDHQIDIRLDEGLYRHLAFRGAPGSGLYWYDLITTPGQLIYRGDFGFWAFARTEDMFEFFRNGGRTERINPHYWSEKLIADDIHTKHQAFSEEKFRAEVLRQFWDSREGLGSKAAEVWQAIREDVLSPFVDLADEHEALTAAYGFRHGDFEFWDVQDWDLKEYSHQYLVALYAIVDGIARYDAAKAHAPQPVPALAA